MGHVDFAMVIHNHQPVGNFDFVFEDACRKCYESFLDAFEREAGFPVSLHYSGSLLEWVEEHRPATAERLKKLVSAGRIEMIGGGMFEPILSMLPRRDRIGQIRMMADHLEGNYGARPRGFWLTERIWEQGLVESLASAGVEYCTIDDSHLSKEGFCGAEPTGCYVTEDEGKTIRILPASERLRYLIPFATVEKVIEYLKSFLSEETDTLVVYADDGEKFGVWPGTFKHVYKDGWLKRFFAALSRESSWLNILKLGDAVDRHVPKGRMYVSDASYREMNEWVLPSAKQVDYLDAVKALEDDDGFRVLMPYLRGGFWRNFKVKYPEAAGMYAKSVEVSGLVDRMPEGEKKRAAVADLYRGQCNCGYWHGVFGGLYLPHLRDAVWRCLVKAEKQADAVVVDICRDPPYCRSPTGGRRALPGEQGPRVVVGDLDLDGREEIKLAAGPVAVYVAPHRGGHAYEMDLHDFDMNLFDTLARRKEASHEKMLRQIESRRAEGTEGNVASIHDKLKMKRDGLDKFLVYDSYRRESLIDHLFPLGTGTPDFTGPNPVGKEPWLTGEYELVKEPSEATAELKRAGKLNLGDRTLDLVLRKTVSVGNDGEVEAAYELRGEAGAGGFGFAVEFNFGLQAGEADDRFYYAEGHEHLGNLSTVTTLAGVNYIGLKDLWRKLDLRLSFRVPGDVVLAPIRTVSLSESGLELLYQCSCVAVVFRPGLDDGGRWRGTITLSAGRVEKGNG